MLEGFQLTLLFVFAAFPFLAWLSRLISGSRLHGFWLYAICVVVGYLLFVSTAYVADVSATNRMNSFDLDGDGGISGDELTPEAQQAMDDWANDTGRTLAPILGLPVSCFWSAIWLVPLCVAQWGWRKYFGKDQPHSVLEDAPPKPDGKAMPLDNPFHTPRDE